MFASGHTRLINKFIGLCKNTIKWPAILADLGYQVQLIEQSVNLVSAEKIKPDVVAFSGKHNHALVADCKSGNNIDSDQNNRYSQLKSNDLILYVTTYDKNQLKHTVCYVDNQNNHSSLKSYTNFPFITFTEKEIQGDGDFDLKVLNDVLCQSISLEGMFEPTSYYPFSPLDEDALIVPHVLRGLISYLSKKGDFTKFPILHSQTAYEILRIVHPLHEYIETREKENLVKTIENIIKLCMHSSKEFSDQISKIERGEFNAGTFRSLQKICDGIVDDYQKQRKITDNYSI